MGRVGQRARVAALVEVDRDVPVHPEHRDQQRAGDERDRQRRPAGDPRRALGEGGDAADDLRSARCGARRRSRAHGRADHQRAGGREDRLPGGRSSRGGGLGDVVKSCHYLLGIIVIGSGVVCADTPQFHPGFCDFHTKNSRLLPRTPMDRPATRGRGGARPFLPQTVDEIIDTIRETVPAYARPLEGAFGTALRAGVERALGDFLDEVEGEDVKAGESSIYAALGRGEAARGPNMDALLAAYRIGARVAWRRRPRTGPRAGFDSETLILLAEAFFAYIDQLSARSAQGFAEEQSALAGSSSAAARRLSPCSSRRRRPRRPRSRPPPTRSAGSSRGGRRARRGATTPSSRSPGGSPWVPAAPLDESLVCAPRARPDAPGPARRDRAALGRRPGRARSDHGPGREAWLSARRARAVHRADRRQGVIDPDGLAASRRPSRRARRARRRGAGRTSSRPRRLGPLEERSPVLAAELRETLSPGSTTRGTCREWPRPCTCTPRPCATGWASCGSCSASGWRTPEPASN